MSVFLRAEWRKLAMANYAIEPSLLAPYLPKGTELDIWNNTCYVSLVGFMFLNTSLKGFKVPFHTNFEEVNLRFYVKRFDHTEWKRGVVFIKEFVPKPALTFVANTFYGEHYETIPMKHDIRQDASSGQLHVEYSWKSGEWNSFQVTTHSQPVDISEGSEAEFITEHYWGYTRRELETSEYAVEHPRWQVYPVTNYKIDVNFGRLYGPSFECLSKQKPLSVFLAEGSEIVVKNAIVLGPGQLVTAMPTVSEQSPLYKAE